MRRPIFSIAMVALCWLVGLPVGVRGADAPDLSTPKKAAAMFANGLLNADVGQIRSAAVGSDEDLKIVESLSAFVHATKVVTDAGIARFGPEEGRKVFTGPNGAPDMLKDIERCQEKVDGDTATLVKPGGDALSDFRLRRQDGNWKVDLARLPEKQEIARSLPLLKLLQKVLDDAAGDIRGGKYKSVAEAQQGIRQQMFAILSTQSRPPAATAPATVAPGK